MPSKHTGGLVAVLFVLLTTGATAQKNKPRTKVVLYKDRIAAQWDTVNCVKNAIKINPLLFLRGEIPVYYERALSAKLSAELGVGVTYRNYINLTIAGDHQDADDFGAGTRILSHPSFHVGLRYYFTDDLEPQGAYMQAEFAYLKYGKLITEQDSTGQLSDRRRTDQRTFNDFRLYFGYQTLGASSNWLFDFYGGVALRLRDMTIVNEKLNVAARQWTYDEERINDMVPAIFLGMKMGLGW
ncbi:MAG: hypothetical protein JST41_09900 [Bacteroidetes bacterium]|nr:hypothetical protein [Bacteroidota bacterium]MBX7129703.1 hypothetical protein [Flavobacteriales bacterium]MCC6654628.1 hypothetical protein [Flavobacteriales bacterium]HMU12410.1 hypothetical protein [Flavobacteriales bacterium]HMW95988.1 hypothetical protein [Flavobacteriales bacterium]